ncbi:MAG: sugar ABC transporter permease [Actinomycetota bacterium]|nr:sugar ABC transporter permease [Actinomycetota bacterium]
MRIKLPRSGESKHGKPKPAPKPAKVEAEKVKPARPKPGRSRSGKSASGRSKVGRLVAPALVVLLAVTAWPLGRAIYLSLYNYPFTNPEARTFVGVDNYLDVLGNGEWWRSMAWAFAIMVVVVVAQLVLGFLFANVLHHVIRLLPLARILVLLPFAAMSFFVAFSWREGLDGGYLNEWFRSDDLGGRVDVLTICLSEIWRGTGIVAVILLAGLTRISPSLMESAVADGAKPWQRFTRIVLPSMGPAAAIAIAYRALDAVRMFDAPFVVARPGSQVTSPQNWIFDMSLTEFEFGLGATMSVVFFLLTTILGVALVRSLRVRRVV